MVTQLSTDTIVAQPTNRTCGCQEPEVWMKKTLALSEGYLEREVLVAVRIIVRRIKNKFSISQICRGHAKQMVKILGMTSHSKSHQGLVDRLTIAYKSIGQWDVFRKKNASWFLAAPRKERGVFTFYPISIPPIISTFDNMF